MCSTHPHYLRLLRLLRLRLRLLAGRLQAREGAREAARQALAPALERPRRRLVQRAERLAPRTAAMRLVAALDSCTDHASCLEALRELHAVCAAHELLATLHAQHPAPPAATGGPAASSAWLCTVLVPSPPWPGCGRRTFSCPFAPAIALSWLPPVVCCGHVPFRPRCGRRGVSARGAALWLGRPR